MGDYYHTCYALSGVAAVQHGVGTDATRTITGNPENELEQIDVYYNVGIEKSLRKCQYFSALPPFNVDGKEIKGSEGKGVAQARDHILSHRRIGFASATAAVVESLGGYTPCGTTTAATT